MFTGFPNVHGDKIQRLAWIQTPYCEIVNIKYSVQLIVDHLCRCFDALMLQISSLPINLTHLEITKYVSNDFNFCKKEYSPNNIDYTQNRINYCI